MLKKAKNIRNFKTGAKRDVDNGKPNFVESISWLAWGRFAKYMKMAAVKYGEGNWIKGIPLEEYEKSLMRHIHKYFSNKYNGDRQELDIDHLSAAMFNLQGIIHEEEKLKLK